ncbi:MAG: tRNA uridine-5-carboxymethylaminomethyl(34) synthesis enzyme MnmG [Chitinivibrionales bacterium]|nr:tRNA uridine-5-carboxymethylaminomethyl(34) synthesis enzyme MnmG [Chitinivibrionales bacterium]MBD3397399.1 tRNA uridine-5-carboxymethylaminomethyl(34) synthesis enzyme MnmG [Chitinivibrionales bacterium]
MSEFDVIIVGGGHAGIEAALAAAKRGVRTVLITSNLDLMGQMSCNPAIGGIAKGNIVREVDALGGAMGFLADGAGIQFRMLNKSKGIAVWGNRAQADKKLYRSLCRMLLENTGNLSLYQGMVKSVTTGNGKVSGVCLESGETFKAGAIVLCMGTFLNGIGHIGSNSFPCGRSGEPPSLGLSESVQDLGIKAGRLKTGTPARIDGRTVDYSKMRAQEGDCEPFPFSYSTQHAPENKAVCWVMKTAGETHCIILDNLQKSALYGGKITGIGPRYCPSIEDKLVKFGERDGHTLFLEPEGLDTHEMYLNGFSTSLPFDIQVAMVKSLAGLEYATIIRPAYAIEYDYFLPTQLFATLESRIVPGLFMAGQINGTSGYEEAACQGLVAGLNAAEKTRGGEPLILGRDTSYTGVLIDDLITRGTEEPYRMFTSRAEYRLLLRQDNADERLMPIAARRGLIEQDLLESRKRVWEKKRKLREKLADSRIEPSHWNGGKTGIDLKRKTGALELLRRPQVHILDILSCAGIEEHEKEVLVGVEADVKYEGFVEKQKAEIGRMKRMEETRIPEKIDYNHVEGLLAESRAKLKQIRPVTLGQASRIAGVTPADISVLIVHLTRQHNASFHVKP